MATAMVQAAGSTGSRPGLRSADLPGTPRPRWLPVVLGQSLRLAARGTAGWAIGLVAINALYVSLWPSIKSNTGYTQVLDSLPQAYRSIMDASGAADLGSATGYLNAEFFSITGPLLILILAVVSGTAAVAGAESSHLLDEPLAAPVSRSRWVSEQAVAVAVRILMVVAATFVTLAVSSPLAQLDIPVSHLAGACLHLLALGLCFGALAMFVGAATGRPVLTRVVTGLLGLIGYLIHALSPMAQWLQPVRPLSPFRWYGADAPLATGAHPAGLAVLLGAALVLTAGAVLVFGRRDLR
jgi:ABC-2 type transport system permease protein